MEALIIDDTPSKGHLIEDCLLNSGRFTFGSCIFHHASTIEEAKDHIVGQHFHFIIIDPAFSRDFGLPLIKTIKDYSRSTKIIAFSLCSTKPCVSECRQQCLECGADYHLDKVKAFGLLPTTVGKCLISMMKYSAEVDTLLWRNVHGVIVMKNMLRTTQSPQPNITPTNRNITRDEKIR